MNPLFRGHLYPALLSGRGHLKSTWNSHFYCYQPGVLLYQPCNNSTTQHARHRKFERLPRISTHNFFDFYFQKRDLTNLFDWFPCTVLFSILWTLINNSTQSRGETGRLEPLLQNVWKLETMCPKTCYKNKFMYNNNQSWILHLFHNC